MQLIKTPGLGKGKKRKRTQPFHNPTFMSPRTDGINDHDSLPDAIPRRRVRFAEDAGGGFTVSYQVLIIIIRKWQSIR